MLNLYTHFQEPISYSKVFKILVRLWPKSSEAVLREKIRDTLLELLEFCVVGRVLMVRFLASQSGVISKPSTLDFLGKLGRIPGASDALANKLGADVSFAETMAKYMRLRVARYALIKRDNIKEKRGSKKVK